MLIVDMLTATGSFSLLICVLLFVFAIGQGRGRRKVEAYRRMLFTRLMDF